MNIQIGKPPIQNGHISNPELYVNAMERFRQSELHNARIDAENKRKLDEIKRDKKEKQNEIQIILWIIVIAIIVLWKGCGV